MRRSSTSQSSQVFRHSVVQVLLQFFGSALKYRGPPSARLRKNSDFPELEARMILLQCRTHRKRIQRIKVLPSKDMSTVPSPLFSMSTSTKSSSDPCILVPVVRQFWSETPSADFWRSKGHVTRIIALHCWNKLLRFSFLQWQSTRNGSCLAWFYLAKSLRRKVIPFCRERVCAIRGAE